ARRRAVTEASLDHPPVEELERVARAEAERLLRVGECLAAVAGPGERPGEDVVAVDRRTLGPADPRAAQGRTEIDAVVDLEEGDLEVGADAVRPQELLDRADQRVVSVREHRAPRGSVEVAEEGDVLRERDRGH